MRKQWHVGEFCGFEYDDGKWVKAEIISVKKPSSVGEEYSVTIKYDEPRTVITSCGSHMLHVLGKQSIKIQELQNIEKYNKLAKFVFPKSNGEYSKLDDLEKACIRKIYDRLILIISEEKLLIMKEKGVL